MTAVSCGPATDVTSRCSLERSSGDYRVNAKESSRSGDGKE